MAYGLLVALSSMVGEVIPVGAGLRPRVRRAAHTLGRMQGIRTLSGMRAEMRAGAVAAQHRAPAHLARTFAVRRRCGDLTGVDLAIQHGSEYSLRPGVHYVTYEDSTLLQALRSYPWPHLSGMSRRDVEVSASRQRRMYAGAVACCATSAWAAQSIVADYGIDARKVHVVGIGANHPIGRPTTRQWWPPRFLFVGADWERKNGARVLSAFESVRARCPEATLDVVGNHPRVHGQGVSEHGFLSLARPDDRARLEAIMARATVLVAPSLHDPSPIVHTEAGSAGVGSIGTRNGGAATILGAGGILVDPLDGAELVEAMLALCDPERAREAGERAYEHAKLMTWTKVAERLLRAGAIPNLDLRGLASFL